MELGSTGECMKMPIDKAWHQHTALQIVNVRALPDKRLDALIGTNEYETAVAYGHGLFGFSTRFARVYVAVLVDGIGWNGTECRCQLRRHDEATGKSDFEPCLSH